MQPNPQETADLVTFTEEILNGKLHFLCSAIKFYAFHSHLLKTDRQVSDFLEFGASLW